MRITLNKNSLIYPKMDCKLIILSMSFTCSYSVGMCVLTWDFYISFRWVCWLRMVAPKMTQAPNWRSPAWPGFCTIRVRRDTKAKGKGIYMICFNCQNYFLLLFYYDYCFPFSVPYLGVSHLYICLILHHCPVNTMLSIWLIPFVLSSNLQSMRKGWLAHEVSEVLLCNLCNRAKRTH